MPWIRFERDFDWRVKPRVVIAIRGGSVLFVTRACADAAIAANAGHLTHRPAPPDETPESAG